MSGTDRQALKARGNLLEAARDRSQMFTTAATTKIDGCDSGVSILDITHIVKLRGTSVSLHVHGSAEIHTALPCGSPNKSVDLMLFSDRWSGPT